MRWRKNEQQNPSQDNPSLSSPQSSHVDVAAPAVVEAAPAGIPSNLPDMPVNTGVVDQLELERAVRRAVARALAEDLGDRGDVTSLATVAPTRRGFAEVVARRDGVFCGTQVILASFSQVDARVTVDFEVQDGQPVRGGQVIATVAGPLRSILTAERTALNFAGHLSGIATTVNAAVEAVRGTGVAIRDTRKTTPGLRLLEKDAVLAGGGHNHRLGLYDALLIKDNHVAAAGSLEAAIESGLRRSKGRRVQVEVTSLEELETALSLGVTDILLDNFTPEGCVDAVRATAGRARLEASGTISIANVREYARTGVDRIAMGSITHSAPWLDIALDVRPAPVEPVQSLSSLAATLPAAPAPLVPAEPPAAFDVQEPAEADPVASSDTDAFVDGVSNAGAFGDVFVPVHDEDDVAGLDDADLDADNTDADNVVDALLGDSDLAGIVSDDTSDDAPDDLDVEVVGEQDDDSVVALIDVSEGEPLFADQGSDRDDR